MKQEIKVNESQEHAGESIESPRPALARCPCCGADAGFGEIRFSAPPPIRELDVSCPMVRCYVHCAYCQTNNNGITHGYATEEQAAEAWNKREVQEWQPIETVPKDGTEILLAHDGEGIIWTDEWMAHWVDEGGMLGCWRQSELWMRDLIEGPTHWMPLPNPPKVNAPARETESVQG